MEPKIVIKGARVHNLKSVDVEIPHNKLVVVTGLSGSGKSTLAFDTIFAEGQRRYVESLSAYARQFLGRVEKPDVDLIEGIAPAIAIEQKVTSRNPRSTVGTTTEIYDYLKLLFARIGRTFSPKTGREIRCYEVDDVVDHLLALPEGERVVIAAPMLLKQSEGIIERMLTLIEDGVNRVIYRGETLLVEEFMPRVDSSMQLDEILVVVDRLKVAHDSDTKSRMADSVARAYGYGSGVMFLQRAEALESFSTHFDEEGMSFEKPTEHLFSFNNPIGACPRCEGYGKVLGIDEDLVVPDKSKSIYSGAVACWNGASMSRWKEELILSSSRFGFPIHTPYYQLSDAERELLWRGNEHFYGINAFFDYVDSQRHKVQYRALKSRYVGKTLCPECRGSRLRPEALYVRVGGKNIAELVQMTIAELVRFFDSLKLDEHDERASERLLLEIRSRLSYLLEVGLHYLTLDRLSSTLSGGESQRINLSTSLGSNLVGSMYILDEPSIGLHPRDTHRLIGVLKELRDLDNTVIVVEHEEEMMRAADWIVDLGPEAGIGGGEIVYNGPADQIDKAQTLTADYLSGRRSIAIPQRRRASAGSVKLRGVRHNNLKNIDIEIPLGVFTCVTGVSGSGKSSLVDDVLYPALKRKLSETTLTPGDHDGIEVDTHLLSSVEMISQQSIGKSTRSNPVTYIKAYDEIRRLFAEQPYAKHTGIAATSFSFNMPGGRCEECEGEGVIKVSMQFMADVELQCEACAGRRFKPEILEVKYRGKSIYDVLEMSVDEAVEFFKEDTANATCRRIVERITPLQRVGLGYVKLGQSSSTLSGGESQRVKLASFLAKERSSERVLFIFDEPTTGLHFHDIKRLLSAFDALIERGHSVVVVEHNMEIIKCADWVIDLGPEAGADGGRVVVAGTPDDVAMCEESYTGEFLRKLTNERV
ncbi:MAG: excinuclease ABC subunit UvrA [Alistipes sp.]|nr:excinuclease ABC subunit UvrA [Alistipes sp.]